MRTGRPWSMFRDVDLGKDGAKALHLADLLSADSNVTSDSDGRSIFPDCADEVFARGRYRSQTVRPFVQYIDCDIELISPRHIKGEHPPVLCVGLLLKGAWQSIINGKPVSMPNVGIPAMMAAGEPFETVTKQRVGQRCRMAAVNVSAEFFTSQCDEDDALFRKLNAFLRPGCIHYEFPNCEVVKSILHKLYNNPYQGTIGRLYAESLVLSLIVELAVHINGGHDHGALLSSHLNQANQAREILDRNLAAAPSINELARHVGTSEATLRRAFKATFGQTIIEYLRDRRLDAARVMLGEGRFQVSQIAYRAGYSDPANFTTAYRRRFGHPPTFDMKRFRI